MWFRDDLRLADNPALRAAIDRGEPVIGLYVLDEESAGIRPLGGAAKWWLHGSLLSLGERLAERGVDPGAAARACGIRRRRRREGGRGRRGLLESPLRRPEREVDAALKTSLREAD